MIEFKLTEEEQKKLKSSLTDLEKAKRKRFNELIIYFAFGTIGAGILLNIKLDFSIYKLLIPLTGLFIIWLSVLIISFKLTDRKRINRIKTDLELNYKLQETAKIKELNKKKWLLILENGFVYSFNDQKYLSWEKGDTIIYSISAIKEFVFDIKNDTQEDKN